VGDIDELLGLRLLGVIPDSPAALRASNMGTAVSALDGEDAGEAYKDAASRLLGEEAEMRFVTETTSRGFFSKMFG